MRCYSTFAILGCSVLIGCLAPTETEPATPNTTATSSAAPAAGDGSAGTVEGPISLIDGKPAPNGVSFPVTAGCHVVRTKTEFVAVTDNVTVRGTIEPVDFVIDVRPGHRYVVDQKVVPVLGRSQVEISARELDASGRELRRFAPMRDPNELGRCQAANAG